MHILHYDRQAGRQAGRQADDTAFFFPCSYTTYYLCGVLDSWFEYLKQLGI